MLLPFSPIYSTYIRGYTKSAIPYIFLFIQRRKKSPLHLHLLVSQGNRRFAFTYLSLSLLLTYMLQHMVFDILQKSEPSLLATEPYNLFKLQEEFSFCKNYTYYSLHAVPSTFFITVYGHYLSKFMEIGDFCKRKQTPHQLHRITILRTSHFKYSWSFLYAFNFSFLFVWFTALWLCAPTDCKRFLLLLFIENCIMKLRFKTARWSCKFFLAQKFSSPSLLLWLKTRIAKFFCSKIFSSAPFFDIFPG